jgi:flagellar biosynthesis GTPase FlhF
MATELKDIQPYEVSLVDIPANGKKFLILKSMEEVSMIELLKRFSDNSKFIEEVSSRLGIAPSELIADISVSKNDDELRGRLEKEKNGLMEALRAILRELASRYGYEYYPEPSEEKEKKSEKAKEENEESEKRKTKPEEEEKMEKTAVEKALREREELRKRLEEVEKQLWEERQKRLDREYMDEVLKYRFSGASREEVVQLLKFADGVIEKSAVGNPGESLRKLLKSFTEVLSRLDGLEVGSSDSFEPGTLDEIETEARKIATAQKVPIHKAYELLFEKRRDLYERYRSSQI